MKTPAPTLSNRAAAQFMRLREIQLREIQLGLRFLCACAHRGEGSSPVLDSFPQALRCGPARVLSAPPSNCTHFCGHGELWPHLLLLAHRARAAPHLLLPAADSVAGSRHPGPFATDSGPVAAGRRPRPSGKRAFRLFNHIDRVSSALNALLDFLLLIQ